MLFGKRTATIAFIFCFLAFGADAALCEEVFRLAPGTRFWLGLESQYLWISGEMLIPAGGQPGSGTKVDVSANLGVDQGEALGITLNGTIVDNHLLDFEYLTFAPSAVRKPSQTFKFHNRTYTPDSIVETRLNFTWLRGLYGYKLLDWGGWWIAPVIGADYVHQYATLNGDSLEEMGISNTRALDAVYPVLGLQARWHLPQKFDLNLQFEGMHFITFGAVGVARLDARWQVHPDITLTAGGGFRLVNSIEDNQPLNNEWNYFLSGVTAGVSFGF